MKSARTEARDKQVIDYLEKLYLLAQSQEYTTNDFSYIKQLDLVFKSKTMSYREIVLVALVGRELNEAYRAYLHFYSCNPRPVFENPIKNFFDTKGFPHTKSGPLNVAKAAETINEAWASRRVPRKDADYVVELMKLIDSKDNKLRTDLGVDLMRMYIASAQHIKALAVELTPSTDPIYLEQLCRKMINSAPDSGNTPQRIVGYLLESHHSALHTGIIVSGTNDSASTTSTTSKKPGDINEEGPDGSIYKVYEVTVKPFDLSRIIDSYDCVSKYTSENNVRINEIIVICRKKDCPFDTKQSRYSFCLGKYEYQNIVYYYWDIYEWVAYMLQHMTPSARELFYQRFNTYVNDTNTHESVKIFWNKLHQG